jgi:uncharacterized membrane protein
MIGSAGDSLENFMSIEASEPKVQAIVQANKDLTQVIYGLYAASLVVGVTMFVAIVLNYVKRDDVVGTYLDSHFRWQIRTFWFCMLYGAIGWMTVWFFIGFLVWAFAFFWFIYRIVKGWLRLTEGKPMYVI